MPVGQCWALRARDAVPVLDWDSDFVVYNPLSGDTHFLDVLGGETLKVVARGAARFSEICEQLAAELDLPNDRALHDGVEQILSQLDELGLIAPAAAC